MVSVGELRVAGEDLICGRVGKADGVIPGGLVEFDHHGEALAIVQEDRVGWLGFDIVPVHRINPHGVGIDGEDWGLDTHCADEM